MGRGSLRHAVHRRVHLERNAPESTTRKQPLEHRDDFLRRIKVVNRRKKMLQDILLKAAQANKKEFKFKMVNHKIENGKCVKAKQRKLSQDEWEKIPLKPNEFRT